MKALRHIVLIGPPGVGKGTFAALLQAQTGWKHLSVGECLRQEAAAGTALGKQVADIMRSGGLVPDAIANEVTFHRLDLLRKGQGQGLASTWGHGVLLDGYPRTVQQAEALFVHAEQMDAKAGANANVQNSGSSSSSSNSSSFAAVQIVLNPEVATEKLLHRRACMTCARDFNTAHIVRDGYDMPAMLPDPHTCPLGPQACVPDLSVVRSDDTTETIKYRIQQYTDKTAPVVQFFHDRRRLQTFHVFKGVKDTPALLETICRQLGMPPSVGSSGGVSV